LTYRKYQNVHLEIKNVKRSDC